MNTQLTSAVSTTDWARRLKSAQIIDALETESVKQGLRKCGLVFNVRSDALGRTITEYHTAGLLLKPLAKIHKAPGFSHYAAIPKSGDSFFWKCVVSKSVNDADEFAEADSQGDHLRIANLLGYPICCAHFFCDIWNRRCFDPVWEHSNNAPPRLLRKKITSRNFYGRAISERIILKPLGDFYKIGLVFRYIGVRLVSHIPCSPSCNSSLIIANDRVNLAKKMGLLGIRDTLDVLQLPYEWRSRDGIANVTTPFFSTLRTPSQNTIPRIVQQESDSYRADGANAYPNGHRINSH